MKSLLIILLMTAFAISQTTRPSTQSASQLQIIIEQKSAAIASLQQRILARKDAAGAEFDTINAGRMSNLKTAESNLQQARISGTAQEKLNASSAYNKLRLGIEADRKAAIVNDAQAHEMSDQISDLTRSLDDLKKEAAAENAYEQLLPPAEPTPESFRNFATRLVPELRRLTEKPSSTLDVVNVVSLLSVDLKKSDSLISPVAGTAVFRVKYVIAGNKNGVDYHATSAFDFVVTFGISNGRWKAMRVVQRDLGPEISVGEYHEERAAKETELSSDWGKKMIDSIQR